VLDRPRVFEDPLAVQILGAEGRRELDDRLAHAAGNGALRAFDSGKALRAFDSGKALRAFVAVRSRLAEDALAERVARGVRQYVVLGAGLDTFAYRNPHDAAGLRVYEVDHPATQGWKRERLAEAALPLSHLVRFVPVDFERMTAVDGLAGAGLRFDRPAAVSWLGVVPYLERSVVLESLRSLTAAFPPGTQVVFDYGIPPAAMSPPMRAGYERLASRVEAAGERFRTFFEPAELARELAAAGFAGVEDWDAAVLNARFFAGRADGLLLAGAGHIVRAWT
jgi:methyltransferase (TIGR00027 family)